jgi:RimJ/RimL family protein N-acetyltransferase
MLVGKKVRLRPIEDADLPRFVAWLGDAEVRHHLALVLGPGLAQEKKWREQTLALPALERPFAVEARAGRSGWRLVGSAGLQNFDWRNRSAELGLVIGDKKLWGRGLGTDVTEVLVRHAFATLNLHRVWLRVFADHAGGRKVYERVGFVLEGRQREGDFRDGQYRDVLVYSLLSGEWAARHADA